MEKKIAILGSTGSIGVQSLDVAEKSGYQVKALTANRDFKKLEEQIRKFKPATAALSDKAAAAELKLRCRDTSTKIYSGAEGVCMCASDTDADTVIDSIVGLAGLRPALSVLESGKTLALANKEALVAGGNLVLKAAEKTGKEILPVDSEHSAIFQCLQGRPSNKALKKIILTASGGPFFGKKREELRNVTVKEALDHPNWSMGAKITIDSATLMNKGLEVIEAVHLFGVSPDDIEVVVHRQSIVHSAVEFSDGAVIAELGTPDMKLPIQYALTYPERGALCCERLSLSKIGTLTFDCPDYDTFPCLKLCIDAIREGGLKPAAANGANEEAVALFLAGKIKFLDIPRLVAAATANQERVDEYTLDDVFEADRRARAFVRESA